MKLQVFSNKKLIAEMPSTIDNIDLLIETGLTFKEV